MGGICQGYVLSHARVTCVMLCDIDQCMGTFGNTS